MTVPSSAHVNLPQTNGALWMAVFSAESVPSRVVLPVVSPRGASDLANADPEKL